MWTFGTQSQCGWLRTGFSIAVWPIEETAVPNCLGKAHLEGRRISFSSRQALNEIVEGGQGEAAFEPLVSLTLWACSYDSR